jgi:DNA invertase Pin-like site-specific DNA recombinase
MTKAKPYALYARTSTDKQDISKQVYSLKIWASDRDARHEVFADDDTSGGSFDNRPEYSRMIDRIDDFEAVVVYKLDRMGRDTLGMLELVENLESRGVGFISITENLDRSTAMGKAFMQLMMIFAELERNHTREKVQWGMNVIRERNKGLPKLEQHNLGRPPRGYTSERGRLAPFKKEIEPPYMGMEVI